MNPDERNEYVRYRLKSAFNTMDAAKILADNGFWNSAINRLYYALFYAVNALLVHSGINSSSHSGLRSQFSLHFIKTGKLEKKFGRLLSELYDWRQKGDYDNIFDYDEETVKPLFAKVQEMISRIEKEIEQK
jgi:hypothetical protein